MTNLRIDSDIFHVWEEDVDPGNPWEPGKDEVKDWEFYRTWGYGSFHYECNNWHIEEVDPESDLMEICLQPGKKYITISSKDCLKCQAEDAERRRKHYECDMDIDFGHY